ncbi:MAG: BrnA antitoxin family protein [Rhodospirillales bacterium]
MRHTLTRSNAPSTPHRPAAAHRRRSAPSCAPWPRCRTPPSTPRTSRFSTTISGVPRVPNPYYRPIKRQLTLRLDADIIAWLRAAGPGYQTRLNTLLRQAMRQDGLAANDPKPFAPRRSDAQVARPGLCPGPAGDKSPDPINKDSHP